MQLDNFLKIYASTVSYNEVPGAPKNSYGKNLVLRSIVGAERYIPVSSISAISSFSLQVASFLRAGFAVSLQ